MITRPDSGAHSGDHAQEPKAGETVLASSLAMINGGKASNQAIAAASLGARASIVTAIGHDSFGSVARGVWDSHGVHQDAVIEIPDASTMVGAVLVDKMGDNRITVAPGALSRLDAVLVESVGQVIRDASVCVVSLEIPVDAAVAALRIARSAGVPAVLDPAPAPADPGDVGRLLALADWVTPNETEAEQLTGIIDPEAAALALRKAGALGVAVTLGARGVLLADGRGTRVIPSPPVGQLIDTAGAGDAFAAAFSMALAVGLDADESARIGVEAGSLVCRGPGFVETLGELAPVRQRFEMIGVRSAP